MLGDAFMIAPLLAKLRHGWPSARIVFTVSQATAPLFATRPWGVEALVFDERDAASIAPFRAAGPYELAVVPGDNRFGLFARAVGARWIVGFSGDRPAYKDRFLDECSAYPDVPGTWGDFAADLIAGEDAPPFTTGQWPAPAFAPFDLPAAPYAVLHLGASTPLKWWPAQRWRALAAHLAERGLAVVWSAGRGEENLVAEVDPEGRYRSYAGQLDLAQIWALLAGALLLVAPDTGIAHMARAIGTPTVALFGPGTHVVAANGRFWRGAPWREVVVDPFPCRDQHSLFKRKVLWVNRCNRSTAECASPRCMQAIGVDQVIAAVADLSQPDRVFGR